MRHDIEIYLGVKLDISYYFTYMTTNFIISDEMCNKFGLIIIDDHDNVLLPNEYLYSVQSVHVGDTIENTKRIIFKMIDEIIDSSYNVGGEKFLECQGNIERLLSKTD